MENNWINFAGEFRMDERKTVESKLSTANDNGEMWLLVRSSQFNVHTFVTARGTIINKTR